MDSNHGNDSQNLAVKPTKQAAATGKSVIKNRRLLGKGFKAAFKAIKFFLQKLIPAIIKSILAFLGPYVILIILLIVLLLIAIEGVASFDFFQLGGERNKAEVLFDNTMKEVVEDRSDQLANPLISKIRGQQDKAPYPPVNEAWLQQLHEKMTPSWAITGILYSYKNLKHTSYRAWHKDFKNTPAETDEERRKAKSKFYSAISKEYDYYFQDPTLQVTMGMGQSSGEKVDIREEITCTYEELDETGAVINTRTEKSTRKSTQPLPSREIVLDANLLYSQATFSYYWHETGWIDSGITNNGNCSTKTFKNYHLYLIDDRSEPNVIYDTNRLLTFLMVDNPKGKLARLIKPKDLEYMMEMLKQIDDRFSSIGINYEGLIKCAKGKDIAGCIASNITDGLFIGGSGGFSSGGSWFPEEYKKIYEEAAAAYGIDWWILASIHMQETEAGRNPAATDPSKGSSVGAKGHFQFMPLTWLGWNFKGNGNISTTRLGNMVGDMNDIIALLTNPSSINKYGGYGKDADGDGISSPWSLIDSAHTAASYLAASGYSKENEQKIKKAIGSYNHSSAYVTSVYNRGIMYRDGLPGGGSIPVSPGNFSFPATGKLTSGYGQRWGKLHAGVDIGGGGRSTVPVVSAADGVVNRSYFSSSYGNVVFIQHTIEGQKYETVYAHLNTRAVSAGQTVKKGQFIGYMGNTGDSQGMHLHFEVHQPSWNSTKSNSKNPLNYIPIPPEK